MLPAPKLAAPTLAFAAVFLAVLMPPCTADPTVVTTKDEVLAKQFTDAIDDSNARDPQSPDTLNARLGLAEFLAKPAGGDCRVRLGNAQNQLDIARVSQAGIALPFALAREAAVDYQIHVGRASCNSSAESRDHDLRAAVESARQAVDLYRDEFDAVSMATMQFNVAVTYHELGDAAAAVAALQTAIQMDREYGFREDANENYHILLQWKGRPAGPDDVAEVTKDFPIRSTTLSFGWFAGKTDQTLTLEYEQLSEGGKLDMRGVQTAERRVQRQASGWAVHFEPRGTHYEIRNWPRDESLVQGMVDSLTRVPLRIHDFDLARAGGFGRSTEIRKFESSMRSDVKAATEFLAQNNVPSRLTDQIRKKTERYGDSIEALVAEAYDLETGTWIGASLDQGVWYDMSAPLSLPLEPGLFVMHQIEFAFTRQVPCTDQFTDEACVEIVLRAAPDPNALKGLLMHVSQALGLTHGADLQLTSAMYMRLVIEPKTLQFYGSDIRRLSYWRVKGTKYDHPVIESERTHAVSGPITRTE